MLPDPQVTALVKELEAEGFTSEHLATTVFEAASERASAVNNGGLYDQVHYLLRGGDHSFKPYEIRFAAQLAKEEDGTAAVGWPLKSVVPDPEVVRREEARRG